MIDSTNPRVMADNIKMLAAGAGGGTTVEANPEGAATGELEKIGIDDDIYSIPKAFNYSTTEHVVGTWINNATLYEKTIDLEALPNNTSKEVSHGITGLGIIASIEAVAVSASGNLPIPYCNVDQVGYQIQIEVKPAVIEVKTKIDFSTYNGYVTIRYTKSS